LQSTAHISNLLSQQPCNPTIPINSLEAFFLSTGTFLTESVSLLTEQKGDVVMDCYDFIVISDIHAHNHKRYGRLINGVNSRLKTALDSLGGVLKLSEELQIKNVVIAGDVFDAKSKVTINVFNAVYAAFRRWSDAGLNVLLVPGNHDFVVRSGEQHALQIFDDLPGFMVAHEPKVIDWTLDGDRKISVCAVPYRDRFQKEWFKPYALKEGQPIICVTHGMVSGSVLNEHNVPVDKLAKDELVDHEGIVVRDSSIISKKWVRGFDLVIAGHIHMPQIAYLSDTKVLIPGQPWQQHAHEIKQQRGVWTVSIKKSLTLALAHTKVETEVDLDFYYLPEAPVFVKYQIGLDGSLRYIDSIQDPEIESMAVRASGNIVLVQPESVKVPRSAINRAVESFYQKGALYVDLLSPDKSGDGFSSSSVRVQLSSDQSPEEVLDTVLCSGFVSLDGFEASDLSELGKEILIEAQKAEIKDV
jgi:DNA repair exonuclease SbcCD nuclease subunit